MDFPLNAKVYCADGECGHSTCLIVNPVSRQVTHLVVAEKRAPHSERLIPVKWIDETAPDMVLLSCNRDKFGNMRPFVETEYLREALPDYDNAPEDYWLLPYRVPQAVKTVQVKHYRIPHGELAVQRGARVDATDGHVGRVDEFLVDATDMHITHLVLRESHLWGEKEVTIPVSEIDRIEEDTVHLKLDKRRVEALPALPVHRSWL
jgi:sporulation protein YlmC with PRC-barrel domain